MKKPVSKPSKALIPKKPAMITRETDGMGNFSYDERKELFKYWFSFPFFFKGMNRKQIEKRVGIDDDLSIELLSCKYMGDFAKKYDVHINTLTQWKKDILSDEHYDPFREVKQWTQGLIKNIIAATYNSALAKDPKANQDRRLFLQLNGWVEKNATEHTVPTTLMDTIKKIVDHDERTDKQNPR
jgi:hypothetical protein